MKKILTLLLVVALVFALLVFVGCGGNTDTDTNSGNVNTDTDTGSQTPEADEDLQAAYNYIKLTYKTLGTTAKNFELMKNAPIGDKVFAITWSVNNDAITITETEDGDFYVVNIPALGEDAINYTLSFSIQNEAGEKMEGSFNLTIPAFAVNTHDEYVEAEDGTSLIIQGIVTGVISKSTNSTKENSLFVQDLNGNGGYYIYNLAEDPNGKIAVGMTVEVRGNKKNYNGTFELVDPVATVIDSTIKEVTPVDITETLLAASGLNAPELTNKNGMLVTIKGVTLLEYLESNGYHYFTIGNHKTYLRVSSSSNCITKDEGATLTSFFNDNFYNGADVTGLIAIYNGDMYLMPVSVSPFTNIVELEKPANVKADTALDNTKLPGIIQVAGNTTLPTTFAGFSDVTIAWELTASDYATLNGNTLAVTIPESAQTITLKATATCGDYSNSKDFTITVKPISTITILEANNIGMDMAHNTYTEELYYIVGTVDEVVNTQYGNLYIVDGEFSLYIYGLYDSTGKVRYDAMNPQPLKKDTIKVLSTIGKYSNDVQLKNAKVVEHTVHADNVGQGGSDAPAVEFAPVNPIVGTKYYFGMVKNGSVYYITGSMGTGNSSYYMASTAKVADAAVVTVIAGPTADTYYITLTVNGATKYMDIVLVDTHKNAVYVDVAPEVGFSFDATTKTFYKVIEDKNYTFGTDLSKTYTTIGGVKVDAETNAMLQISFAEAHTCTFTDIVTAPTCDDEGYTTHTCACGNVVLDTKVDALGHSFTSGVCTVCGATDHEHDYDAEVTAPTCGAAGYTTYTCKVDGCNDSYTEAGEAATGAHADNNSDFKCDGCNKAMLPADGSTLTIEQALAIGAAQAHNTYTTEKYYVTGTITEVYNTQYGNLYITDGTKTITVYGLYKDGTRYDAMTVKPVAGETITVYGGIGQYNGTPQFKNAELSSHTAHTCVGGAEANCTTAQTCTECGKTIVDALGHNYVDGTCDRCGAEKPAAGETVLPENLSFVGLANKASADSYMKSNFPEWTINGKLGNGYADYLGFGRSGDATSSIKSSAISTSTAFTITTVLKGNGSNGVATSTLTFTLVDASGNTIATGYANGSTTAAITPADAKDTTYNISFTFVEGKTWSDVSNLVISFAKATGNIGLKSLEFIQ